MMVLMILAGCVKLYYWPSFFLIVEENRCCVCDVGFGY